MLPRQQFQLLYRELGFEQAKEVSATFIRWPVWDTERESQMAPDYLLHQWAMAEDRGESKIQKEVETAFNKRWENYAKAIALETIRGTAQLSRDYTALASKLLREAKDGHIDQDILKLVRETTSLLLHANNGTGFIFRELVGQKKEVQQTMQVGRLTINAGPPPKNKITTKRIKEAIPATIDAEFRELPVGN